MTRTHFKAIARIVNNNTLANDSTLINKDYLIGELCEYMSVVNERFDKDMFVSACSLED